MPAFPFLETFKVYAPAKQEGKKQELERIKNHEKHKIKHKSERLPFYDLETHCCSSLVAKLRLGHSQPHGLAYQAPLSI